MENYLTTCEGYIQQNTKTFVHLNITVYNHLSSSHQLRSKPKIYPQTLHKCVLSSQWPEPTKFRMKRGSLWKSKAGQHLNCTKRPTTCLHVPNSFSMHTTPVSTISKEMTNFQTRRCPNHVIQIQMDSKQEIWNGCSIRGMYWKQIFLSSWTWIWDLLFNSLLLPPFT